MKIIIVGSGCDLGIAEQVAEKLQGLENEIVLMDPLPPHMTAEDLIAGLKQFYTAVDFPKLKSKYHK